MAASGVFTLLIGRFTPWSLRTWAVFFCDLMSFVFLFPQYKELPDSFALDSRISGISLFSWMQLLENKI